MANRLLVVAGVVLLCGPTFVDGQSKSPTAQTDPALQKAIGERRAARATGDIATWSRLTADDSMDIHSDGRVHTKTEEIAEIKAATPPATPPDTHTEVRVYGSSAVYTAQRNPAEGPRRLTTIWAKNANGQWQAVHTQQTVVTKK